MPDYGIDVSAYNTITDWTAVRGAGNSWAWAKATQGNSYVNPLFASQIAGARSAGLLVGAYHFPDPNVSVAANVGHFVSVAAGQHALDTGCFVPLLDVEDDPADGIVWTAASANAFVKAFRDQLRAATGVQHLCVYGSESWFTAGKLDPAQWADDAVTLCIAQYAGVPGKFSWSHPKIAVHQYTNSAPTPGATAPTDRSTTVGTWTAADLTIGDDMALDPTDPIVQNLVAGANSVQFGQAGVRQAGGLALAVYNIAAQLTAIQGALQTEEADLLAAIKAAAAGPAPAASVDPTAVAKALEDAGLPGQVVSALLAVLSKAAA